MLDRKKMKTFILIVSEEQKEKTRKRPPCHASTVPRRDSIIGKIKRSSISRQTK
jgi:hypothetical protein